MSLRLGRRRKKRELKQEDLAFMRKEVSQWTSAEVGLFLVSIDLPQYQDLFFFNEVDGEMLADIDEDDLLAFPIEKIAHRKKILRRIQMAKGLDIEAGTLDTRSDAESFRSDSCSTLSSLHGRDGVRIKCAYHDDIRTLDLDPNETYEQFRLKILEEFGANKSVKYKDEDGDLITIKNNEDVRSMVLYAATKSVKVIVYSSRRKKKVERTSSSSRSRGRKGDRSRSSNSKKDRKSEEDPGVLENFVEAVIISNRRGVINFWNAAAEDLFGYDREEAIGQNVSILMPAGIAKNHNKYIRRYRREGNSRIIGKGRQIEAIDKDGNTLNVWISLSETNTTFTAMMKLIQDGERTLVDAKDVTVIAKGVREEFASLDEYQDPMVVIDRTGTIQYVNHVTHSEFVFEDGKLIGQPISVICPAIRSTNGDADLLADYITIQKGIRTDGNLLKNNMRDVVCYTSKGFLKAFNAEFSSRTFLGNELYMVRFWRISDSYGPSSSSAPASVLKSALQMQREVIMTLVVPAVVISEDCMIQEMNAACCDMFGYSVSEVLGRNVNILIPPGEVHEKHQSWVKAYALTGEGKGPDGASYVVGKGREVVSITKSGKPFTARLTVTETESLEGKIYTGIFFFLAESDIAIEESPLLRQQVDVISSLYIAACVITGDSKIRAWNEGCVQLWGYQANEVLNQEVDVLMPLGELRGRHRTFVRNFSEGKKKMSESMVVGRGRKVTGRHKNGSFISVMLFVTERREESVVLYTGIFHNI